PVLPRIAPPAQLSAICLWLTPMPVIAWTLLDDAGGCLLLEANQLKVADSGLLDFHSAGEHTVRVFAADRRKRG
ncbi:MAG: hypothetical protein MUC60_09290, partial [Oscillatoria sp. Prado101]|nr:hypothetical protein [Oscillatoria sp. Prado101]